MNPLPYLAVSITLLILLYVTGGFIVYAFRLYMHTPWQAVFMKLLSGTLGVVFIYSVAVTKGSTVNLGLLIPVLPLLVSLFLKRQFPVSFPSREVFRLNLKKICEVLAFTLLVFFFFFIIMNDQQFPFPAPPHPDYIYYARLSDYLNATGIENGNLAWTGNYGPPAPYHYFEIWLNAGISQITGLPSLLTQQLVCDVVLFVLLYTGMLALAESAGGTPGIGLRILSVSFFFFQGIRWPFFAENLLQGPDYFYYAAGLFHKKYLFTYTVLCSFLVHAFQKRNTSALLTLLLLPVISISSAIPVVLSLLLIVTVNRIIPFCRFNTFKVLLAAFILALFLFLFYHFHEVTDPRFSLLNSGTFLETNTHLLFPTGITSWLFLNNLFFAMLMFFPVMLILAFQLKKLFIQESCRFILLTTLILVSVSSATFALWNQKYDSSQLFSNTGMTVFSVALFSILIWLYIHTRHLNFRYALLVLLSVWSCFQLNNLFHHLSDQKASFARSYSTTYMKEVNEALQSIRHPGGRISNRERIRNFKDFALDLNACPWYLGHLKNNFRMASLDNIRKIPLSSDSLSRMQERAFLESQQFHQFIQQQEQKGIFIPVNESRLDYIRKNKLGYLFLEAPEILDEEIARLVIKTIRDSLSGEQLLLLSVQENTPSLSYSAH